MAGIAETAENPAPTSEMSKEAKIACRTPASMVTMVLRSVETRNIGDNESLDPTAGVVSVDRPSKWTQSTLSLDEDSRRLRALLHLHLPIALMARLAVCLLG